MVLYKILLVDDEQIVLDSMKFVIEKNFEDALVAGTARSGREAIEKAESIRPDIILMDIKMPGINGIDAIREIKKRYNNAFFIIISAFDQFEFAKDAVNLGVVEYLLKPVNKNKLVETIRKAIMQLNIEKERRKTELELKEKLEIVTPILENGFISSIVFSDDHSTELKRYKELFEITEEYGYIITVEFGENIKSGYISNKIGVSVKVQSFYPIIRDLIKSRFRCFIGPVMLNRIVIFVPCDLEADEYQERIEAINVANFIFDTFTKKVEADFFVGIGRIYKGMENLTRSYEESLRAINYCSEKGVVHIMDVPIERNINTRYPAFKEKMLLEMIAKGETNTCLKIFFDIFDWLADEYSNSLQEIKINLIELVVLLHRLAWDYKIDDNEFLNQKGYLEEFLVIEELSELKLWCRERIKIITEAINYKNKNKVSSIILKAKEYIDKNYEHEITLMDVAKAVNVSPQYFSKLFKDETNKNFIEYLTSVRIKKAKEFLEAGELSVKEICYKIGYGDPNYFSRIFKKITGYTPSEYKEIRH